MKDDFMTLIHFHHTRVEKSLLYIMKTCVNPRLLNRDQTFSLSAQKLLQDRVFRLSLQAYEFLKAGLLTVSMVCSKVREIYCNQDESIMRQYLLNYHNPMTEEEIKGAEEDDDAFAEEREGRPTSRGRKRRVVSASSATDYHEQRQLLKSPKSRFTAHINQFKQRSASPPQSRSASRPKTAPVKLQKNHYHNDDDNRAMRSFSPKKKLTNQEEGDDFQTIPLNHIQQNTSYYSDFEPNNSNINLKEEEDFRHRTEGSFIEEEPIKDNRRKKSTATAQSENDDTIQTVQEGSSLIPDEANQENNDDVPNKNNNNNNDKIRHSYSSMSQYSNEFDKDKLLEEEENEEGGDDEEKVDNRGIRGVADGVADRRKKKKKKKIDHMIITKKDLLVAQMKNTKLNESLLLQDIIQEEILQKSAPRTVHSSTTMNYSSSQFEYNSSTELEHKSGNNNIPQNRIIQYLSEEEQQRVAQQSAAVGYRKKKGKKIECSCYSRTIYLSDAKSFPQFLDTRDQDAVEKATQALGNDLRKDLHSVKIQIRRNEYSHLYSQLMGKLKRSVNKSNKRYSFVKTQSDGHLSGSISPKKSISMSVLLEDEIQAANSPDLKNQQRELSPPRQQPQQRLTGQKAKYAPRPTLHHDARFCSYECMKRWTIFYCPVQLKYESEILIDMVAGYSVRI
jgi:hypothetical protein